jgi:hypothetical protein
VIAFVRLLTTKQRGKVVHLVDRRTLDALCEPLRRPEEWEIRVLRPGSVTVCSRCWMRRLNGEVVP